MKNYHYHLPISSVEGKIGESNILDRDVFKPFRPNWTINWGKHGSDTSDHKRAKTPTFTCLHPRSSIISGGKTREAKARLKIRKIRNVSLFSKECLNSTKSNDFFISLFLFYLKMALNSVPSPPMPILVKSQSGLIIDCLSIFPLLLPVNLKKI